MSGGGQGVSSRAALEGRDEDEVRALTTKQDMQR